ncbi:MAG TPA: hypothetical protein VLI72_12715 [Methylibium sp.]|nr:hypothetical protein [Methylibium sp.]
MSATDTCCSIVPYFKVHAGQLEAFKALSTRFIERTRSEPKCLHYAFSFDGDQVHCREGYEGAAGLLAHLENIGALLGEALQIADVTRVEVHALAADIEQLREPLKGLSPQFFALQPGGLRR